MQRFIPSKSVTPIIIRAVLKVEKDKQKTIKFYALTGSVRIDGKTEYDQNLWIKLNDIDEQLNLITHNYSNLNTQMGSNTAFPKPDVEKKETKNILDITRFIPPRATK